MKRILMAIILLGASSSALAVSPGGPNCGWGNLLFEGKNGLGMHLLATLFNGSTGNATFGMTTGTNGCNVDGNLTYRGENLLSMTGVMDEVAHDMAQGQGEALTALAVALGVDSSDRAHFDQVMYNNFDSIFPDDSVTVHQVAENIHHTMASDGQLKHYI